MAARLLNYSFLANLNKSTAIRQALYYRHLIRPHGVESRQVQHARLLHVKVYDKDAGFNEQRQANKYKFQEPVRVSQMPKSEEEANANSEQQEQKVETITVAEDDADVFGNISKAEEEEPDEGDLAEEEYTKHPPTKRLRPIDYARLIKDELKANRLKDALAILERMKRDRVQPDVYIYNLLISGCAKAGYTKKAFNLFTKLRQRGLQPKGGTYTSLFNACANAPVLNDGLARANRVREIMLEKGYEPNVKNYNAMIKAYGRCGDVKTAYLLADEMMERQLPVNTETFNFLLQACASDNELGFRHCLLTWHKMLKNGISPDYYTFSTLLRCVRDCGFGDLSTMEQVLQQIIGERSAMAIAANSEPEPETNTEVLLKEETNPFKTLENPKKTQTLAVSSEASNLEMPNLLALQPHLGSLIAIAEVTKPHERFLLLGGQNNFMTLMKQNNVTPDIEMFTAMLEVVPPTYAAEKQIISWIRKIGLKADIDFFNILIKKRSMRFDYEGAKEVLSMIRTAGLHPDIVTYGVLALGCQTQQESRELLQQMRSAGVSMNMQILGAMLRQGCAHKNFDYINEIIQISLDENVKPNEAFITHLHNFYNRCARAIDARHPSTKTKEFKKAHRKFCDKWRLYQEEHGIAGLKHEDAIKKLKTHPYKHFKEEDVEGLEPLKNEKLTKKQKLRKYIKKIKVENLRSDETEETPSASEKQKQLE